MYGLLCEYCMHKVHASNIVLGVCLGFYDAYIFFILDENVFLRWELLYFYAFGFPSPNDVKM